jgi:CO dehydrogenase/acetyl-CoA synthase beta subunit
MGLLTREEALLARQEAFRAKQTEANNVKSLMSSMMSKYVCLLTRLLTDVRARYKRQQEAMNEINRKLVTDTTLGYQNIKDAKEKVVGENKQRKEQTIEEVHFCSSCNATHSFARRVRCSPRPKRSGVLRWSVVTRSSGRSRRLRACP